MIFGRYRDTKHLTSSVGRGDSHESGQSGLTVRSGSTAARRDRTTGRTRPGAAGRGTFSERQPRPTADTRVQAPVLRRRLRPKLHGTSPGVGNSYTSEAGAASSSIRFRPKAGTRSNPRYHVEKQITYPSTGRDLLWAERCLVYRGHTAPCASTVQPLTTSLNRYV